MVAAAYQPRQPATLNVPFSTHLISAGRGGFLPFTFSSMAYFFHEMAKSSISAPATFCHNPT
jgi:hypothetical protein